jgi:hypothetical protein
MSISGKLSISHLRHPAVGAITLCRRSCNGPAAIVNEDWCGPRQHMVRVRAGVRLPATLLVSRGLDSKSTSVHVR